MKREFSNLISARASKLALSLTVLAIIGLTAPFAMAEDKGQMVAVLNMQSIMQESDVAESIRDQIDKKRQKYQKEIEKLEENLKSSEQELVKQKSVLSEEAFTEKRKTFEKDIIEAQRDIQQKRMALERAFGEAMAKLRGELVKVVAEVAESRGIDVVLSRQSVVIADADLDITEDALKALNKKVKKIKVTIDE